MVNGVVYGLPPVDMFSPIKKITVSGIQRVLIKLLVTIALPYCYANHCFKYVTHIWRCIFYVVFILVFSSMPARQELSTHVRIGHL